MKKLTKRQKACIGILGLARTALAVDRALLGSDETENESAATSDAAAPPPAPASSAEIPVAPTAAQAGDQPVQDPLAERLQELAKSRKLTWFGARNAFHPSPKWLATCKAAKAVDPERIAADRFIKDHQLKAVILSGRAASAVVGDKCLYVGQSLDGFKLVAVDRRSATFASGPRRVVLTLRDDSPPGG